MLTLYSIPGTCALSVHIALEWSGLPYQVKILKPGQNREASYLDINPLGSVPALRLANGDVLTEATALLTYLDALKPDAFEAPSRDPIGRARLASVLSFFASEVHAAFGPHFAPGRFLPDADHHEDLKAQAYERIAYLMGRVEDQFEGPFQFGSHRSVADSYLFVICRWVSGTPIDLQECPALDAFKRRIEGDPDVVYALSQYELKH